MLHQRHGISTGLASSQRSSRKATLSHTVRETKHKQLNKLRRNPAKDCVCWATATRRRHRNRPGSCSAGAAASHCTHALGTTKKMDHATPTRTSSVSFITELAKPVEMPRLGCNTHFIRCLVSVVTHFIRGRFRSGTRALRRTRGPLRRATAATQPYSSASHRPLSPLAPVHSACLHAAAS